jgi:hypothetical protein
MLERLGASHLVREVSALAAFAMLALVPRDAPATTAEIPVTAKTGQVVIPEKYDGAHSFQEGLAAVQVSDKWGYIDKTGKMIVAPQFVQVVDFIGGLAFGETQDYDLAFIDKTGHNPFGVKFQNISDDFDFAKGYVGVEVNNKWGFIDKTGKYILTPQFDERDTPTDCCADSHGVRWQSVDFREGLAAVNYNGKWGYIDATGKSVIPAQFDDARNFSEGVAVARQGQKYGFIDHSGNWVIAPQFDSADSFAEGLADVELNNTWGWIGSDGKFKIPAQFDWVNTPFLDDEDIWQGGPAIASVNGVMGYVDKSGHFTPEHNFSYLYRYSEDLSAAGIGNALKGRYGFIDRQGKIVIPLKYRFVLSFSEDLAVVESDDSKFGYISR